MKSEKSKLVYVLIIITTQGKWKFVLMLTQQYKTVVPKSHYSMQAKTACEEKKGTLHIGVTTITQLLESMIIYCYQFTYHAT